MINDKRLNNFYFKKAFCCSSEVNFYRGLLKIHGTSIFKKREKEAKITITIIQMKLCLLYLVSFMHFCLFSPNPLYKIAKLKTFLKTIVTINNVQENGSQILKLRRVRADSAESDMTCKYVVATRCLPATATRFSRFHLTDVTFNAFR